ncbi:MAG: hypothetical protein DRI46_10745 [Chloroflexi bacterium]|nr:MAG: hypothetical protein DRI46_10745 [Chloroflexota bacterium]
MDNQQQSKAEEKECRVCKRTRFVGNFKSYSSGGKTLHKNICIPCEAEWHKTYRGTHPDKIVRAEKDKQRARDYRRNNPEKLKGIHRKSRAKCRERDKNAIYKHYGDKCSCCGETDRGFFTIDHVDSDGHIERKQGLYTSGSQFYRYIIQQDFPESYQILCYNCNLGRARNKGVCPHRECSTTKV